MQSKIGEKNETFNLPKSVVKGMKEISKMPGIRIVSTENSRPKKLLSSRKFPSKILLSFVNRDKV